MKILKSCVIAGLLGVACVVGTTVSADKGPPADCATAAKKAPSRGPHTYFESLITRSDCMLAYSLRDQDQLDAFKHSQRNPAAVTYAPKTDPDPRRQDAAKVVITADKVSLQNQLRLPMSTADGTTTLVTWDAWFGSEFEYDKTRIGTYKTFEFTSPSKEKKWLDIRTRFKQDDEKQARRVNGAPGGEGAKGRGSKEKSGKGENTATTAQSDAPASQDPRRERKDARRKESREAGQASTQAAKPATGAPAAAQPAVTPPAAGTGKGPRAGSVIAVVDARGSAARPFGPNVTKATPLAPQVGTFAIRAETWTRYWLLIEQRANDFDRVSLWVADEGHDPVQILDGLQLSVKETVASMWLEFNTSSKLTPGLAERVAYARNVVMLRNPKDVKSLFQRPTR